MNALRSTPGPFRRQRGVVLVTALIVLVIMTILGLASIQSTVLQSKMTGNLRETNGAFQAAEAGLQAGLIYIENNFAPPMAESDANVHPGCTVGASTSDTDCAYLDGVMALWEGTRWSALELLAASVAGIKYGSGLGSTALKEVKYQPRILIDERQVRTDVEVGAPIYYYYTVSAVGTGPSGTGRSILQTTIVKRTQ